MNMDYCTAVFGAQKIYDSLLDEDSRKIYKARIEYLFTENEDAYLRSMEQTDQMRPWVEEILTQAEEQSRKLFLFGAGNEGRTFLRFLRRHGKAPFAYCDNNEKLWGTSIEGIPVLAPEEMFRVFNDDMAVITMIEHEQEVREQLVEGGIREKSIRKLTPFLNLYFDVFNPGEKESFIDAGCYNGQTALAFARWCKYRYDAIYAFEPNAQMETVCRRNFEKGGLSNVTFIGKGTWNRTQRLSFRTAGQGSTVGKDGDEYVEVTSIDEALSGKPVSFIKMDVEGSELQSLEGAAETIKKFRPRMAISLYHRPEDILLLPACISRLVPNYQYYIRHYSFDMRETVLYAV